MTVSTMEMDGSHKAGPVSMMLVPTCQSVAAAHNCHSSPSLTTSTDINTLVVAPLSLARCGLIEEARQTSVANNLHLRSMLHACGAPCQPMDPSSASQMLLWPCLTDAASGVLCQVACWVVCPEPFSLAKVSFKAVLRTRPGKKATPSFQSQQHCPALVGQWRRHAVDQRSLCGSQ